MNQNEAMEVIKEACASVTANFQVHQRIQAAIAVVEVALENNSKASKN